MANSNSETSVVWTELVRWVSIVVFVAGITFWVGVRLTGIETGVEHISKTVGELRIEVRQHNSLPSHPLSTMRAEQLERRVNKLESGPK